MRILGEPPIPQLPRRRKQDIKPEEIRERESLSAKSYSKRSKTMRADKWTNTQET